MPNSHTFSKCFRGILVLLLGTLANSNGRAEEAGPDLVAFRREVKPILAKACFACHGPTKQKADLRLDVLNADLLAGADAETWHDVLNKLNLGEMPPKSAPPLSNTDRQIVVAWLTRELQRAAEKRRSTGGRVAFRRLTNYEYNNTMQDLLGIDLDFAKDLPPDPRSKDGFHNNGATLSISPLQVELYLDAARLGLKRTLVVGDKPCVFKHRAEKSEKVRRVKEQVSNRLGRNNRFLVRVQEFPREGEVSVRVRAGAIVPKGAAPPRMRVAMGVRADVRAPERTLATVEVQASADAPQTFEFRGRIEDFPLPGHNPKYPGLQITIYNDPEDGSTTKKRKRNKKQTEPDPSESILFVESVEFKGPMLESWPPPHHTNILFPRDQSETEEDYIRKVLKRFLTRAYRRPATPEDIAPLMTIFAKLRPVYPTLEETVREVLAVALISPDFLFLVEQRSSPDKREPLTDYELAARLSYFLWSTLPDAPLLELAVAGKLHEPEVLRTQVERMLGHPKSRQFVGHFSGQWFDLAALDRVAVNPEFYPNFDNRLKADMRKETQLFFGTILDENLSCLTLLDADFTVLNRRLAKHYGLEGPRGESFERVALAPDDRRGGLLSQGSFLLANSNGEDSHPIKRAVWLLDRLLDNPPPPPPPDVPELDPTEPDFAGLPLKRQLEVHRKKEACNNCHRKIDPFGIAFEHYDAIGRWRTKTTQPAKGKKRASTAIDASAVLPDGTKVDGLPDLQRYLLEHRRPQFAEATVRRLLTYSLGRSLELADRPAVEALSERFTKNDYRLRELIVAIVQGDLFQTK